MNDDVIADLKQFIEATVSQHTADLPTRDEVQKMIDESVSGAKDGILGKVEHMIEDSKNEIIEAIGDTMTTRDEVVDEQLTNHEQRLTRLEQRAA